MNVLSQGIWIILLLKYSLAELYLKQTLLEYPKALCNDGTSATYYYLAEPPENTRKIMIYLMVRKKRNTKTNRDLIKGKGK